MSNAELHTSNPLLPGTVRNESLQRAFDLLEVLAQLPEGASIAQLSSAVDLPRSTVARLLASLFDAGVVARPGMDRHWVLGPTIMRLTRAVAPAYDLRERSTRIMQSITEELEETSMLAVPTGSTTARVINEVKGPKLVGVATLWEGHTISSAASGFVRQLLAELPPQQSDQAIDRIKLEKHTSQTITDRRTFRTAIERIRNVGYTTVIDELEEGLAGVGVPVRHDGQITAMLAIYLPTVRFTDVFRQRALFALKAGAKELESR